MNITVDLNILHGAAPSSAVFAKNEREASSFSIQEKKKKVRLKRTILFTATNNSSLDVSNIEYVISPLLVYILHWILFSRAFFRSWKRSILKSCSNKWNKDWFAWYFPLEKKYPTRIKEKMKDAKLYLLSPFLRDHELNTANHRWIRSCFSSNIPAFIYILPSLLFIVSIRISLTTFSRHRGALSRRQKEESEIWQFIRNSLH